jgi:hypothetical protein
MQNVKRTYALPEGTINRFEREVDAGRRSGVVADLIEQFLEEKRKEALRRDIEEGCREMNEIYKEVQREFETIDMETLRGIEY